MYVRPDLIPQVAAVAMTLAALYGACRLGDLYMALGRGAPREHVLPVVRSALLWLGLAGLIALVLLNWAPNVFDDPFAGGVPQV
jgi:hypothetical protein